MIVEIGGSVFSQRIVNELSKRGISIKFSSPSLKDFKFKEKIRNYPIIHYTGSPTVTIIGLLSLIRFKIWKKKIVVSWIGFDVRRIKHDFFWRLLTKLFKNLVDVHITEDDDAVNQLKKIGVNAIIKKPPLYLIFPLKELPKEKKVAIYLPDKLDVDFNFYQGNLIKKLVNEFEDVSFIIVNNSGKYFTDNKNVKCIQWTDNMEEIYEQVICVIRLPLEDVTGATMIESLSMGRHMIASSTNFPHCTIITNYNELRSSLSQIIENPTQNVEGSNYVHKHYNNDLLASQFIDLFKNLSTKN